MTKLYGRDASPAHTFSIEQNMSQELIDLVSDEMTEVNKIVGHQCKIEFTTEGRLSHTGYKVTAKIAKDVQPDPDAWYVNSNICTFYLTQFPGNCGMLITHETYQPSDWQKKGLSVPIQRMKEKLARHLKYTILLATTIPSNKNDNVLEKAGFKKLEPLCFTNKRTNHPVTTWMKILHEAAHC